MYFILPYWFKKSRVESILYSSFSGPTKLGDSEMNCGSFKPIFPQNVNAFTLGRRVGLDPRHEHCVLPRPTKWFSKTFADSTRTLANPTQTLKGPRRGPTRVVEYGLVGSPCVGIRVGHVNFILFVYFFLALGN